MYNYLMMNAYTPCFILKFSLKPLLKTSNVYFPPFRFSALFYDSCFL